MKRQSILVLTVVVVVVFTGVRRAGADLTFTTIDVPGMDNTSIYAIDGGNIGGYYNAAGGGERGPPLERERCSPVKLQP